MSQPHARISTTSTTSSPARRLRGVPEDRIHLGSPARMPRMRPRRLLRFVPPQARDQTLPRDAASDHDVRAARRKLKYCYVDEIMWE